MRAICRANSDTNSYGHSYSNGNSYSNNYSYINPECFSYTIRFSASYSESNCNIYCDRNTHALTNA